jgi:hypothetical protein
VITDNVFGACVGISPFPERIPQGSMKVFLGKEEAEKSAHEKSRPIWKTGTEVVTDMEKNLLVRV